MRRLIMEPLYHYLQVREDLIYGILITRQLILLREEYSIELVGM
nr:MAG TPA: hypothetical protein [Caudoviricetes sp.]